MEPEFVDPGPDQPYVWPPALDVRAPVRETVGVLIMLIGAALLSLLAATSSLFAVDERTGLAHAQFSVDAWGNYDFVTDYRSVGHAPRFGLLLTIEGAAFALLALLAAIGLLARAGRDLRHRAGLLAAAAGAVAGVLVGVTAAMALTIQSAFDDYRVNADGLLELRMRIGGAVWLSVAALLAGGLSVTAALRVRRISSPVVGPLPGY